MVATKLNAAQVPDSQVGLGFRDFASQPYLIERLAHVILFELQVDVHDVGFVALEAEPLDAFGQADSQVALHPGFEGLASSSKQHAASAIQESFDQWARMIHGQSGELGAIIIWRPGRLFARQQGLERVNLIHSKGFIGGGSASSTAWPRGKVGADLVTGALDDSFAFKIVAGASFLGLVEVKGAATAAKHADPGSALLLAG